MTQTVTVTQASIADLIEQRDALLEVAKACRSKFEEYALLHYRKRTTDGDEKALSNQRMATLCDDAIAKASPIAGLTEIGERDEL